MKTPAIPNLINVTSLQSPDAVAAKQSRTSSDMQFNQMLSRGIEERRNTNESGKPIAKESTPVKQAAQSTRTQAPTNKAGASEESNATSIDEEATVSPAADAPVASVKAGTEVDAEREDDEAALAASSDELLALVANIAQINTPATAVPAEAVAQVVAADSAEALGTKPTDPTSVVDLSATGPAPADKAHATVQAALTALRNRAASEATTSEEPGAATEFDSSLAQASDKPAPTANPLAQASSSENDHAAAMQSGSELRAAQPASDTPLPAPGASINVAPQSQASVQQMQAAVAAATDKLTPRVGSNGWDQAIGQKIVWMVAGEQQSATLTLNPPDLGPLQVVLNVSNSEATVNFTAAQPEVRQALENAVPKLREMLGDAGIQLGQANVSAGTPNNQQGGSGERQQASRGNGAATDDGANAPVGTVRSQTITGSGQGLVDTFA